MLNSLLLLALTSVGGHPESVSRQYGQIYVSNMGQEAGLLKDGDGYISRLDFQGNLLDPHWIKPDGTLNSPTAMLFLRGELIVCDIDRLVRFDAFTKKVESVIDFSPVGAGFLNDLVFIGRDHVAVTESKLKKVFIVDLKDGTYEPLAYDQSNPEPFAPNGLAFSFAKDFNGGTLYISENEKHAIGSQHGRVTALRLDRDHRVISERFSPLFGSFLDGITVAAPDLIHVSDWVNFGADGQLHTLDGTSLGHLAASGVGIDGFADFALDDQTSRLISPDLVNGNVAIHQIPGAWDSPESGEHFLQCRAQLRIDQCSAQCQDQFCLRECFMAADFTCSEFNSCNTVCIAGCEDQFCIRDCGKSCREKIGRRRQGGGVRP